MMNHRKSRKSFLMTALTSMAGGAAMLFPAALLAEMPAQNEAGRAGAVSAPYKPQVIAHRGGAMNRPENTLPAFHHAMTLGVDVLELDMLMTADDQIVVYHDAVINPQFCKPDEGAAVAAAPVRQLSLTQIRQFDCGGKARPAYAGNSFVAVPGARIPTPDEVLGAVQGGKALLFVETKVPKQAEGGKDIDPVLFAKKLNDVVRAYGLEDRVILQSFDYRTIDALHKMNPRIRTCLLGAQKLTRDYEALLRRHHASCVVLGDEEVGAEEVRRLQQAGILVYSGVADDEKGWDRYVALGMDALFTNDPEGLIAYLKRAGLRQNGD